MQKATLSLFNAVQVGNKKRLPKVTEGYSMGATIPHGFILSPEAQSVCDDKLFDLITDTIGISGEKANAAFHKSWKVIEESSDFELRLQQILHYITTYGFEAVGIYSQDSVYIPAEVLNIPKLKDGIKLVVIKGLTKEEVLEKIVKLGSGIALKPDTMESIMEIITGNMYDVVTEILPVIKNKELKSKIYDAYDIMPTEPTEYLRYLLQKLTNDSLLIKSDRAIRKIKECNTKLHIKTLDGMLKHAPRNLAEIFLRYKPLFLALKSISKDKTFFNQLRKKAEKLHKPMKEDYLNSVTGKLRNDKKITKTTLFKELAKVNIFRKIRLAYALKFRTTEKDSIVYKVRNGRGYATEFEFENFEGAEEALEVVLNSIVKDLDVKGQLIYLPDYINYALPATEKMFTGNFPTGTYVTVPKDMIVGIHWFNTSDRVDLDLSTVSANGKIGWDRNFRNGDNTVLFSGDITDAPRPKGASELFYIKSGSVDDQIMYVNYFNQYGEEQEVEAKIIVAQDAPKNFAKGYMVDPNKIVAVAPILINKKSNVLGLITKVDGENRFYFSSTSIGNNITSGYDDHSNKARKFLADSLKDTIDFREILVRAGAKIVTEKPAKKEFLDLSPEALDKTTIIDLITKK